MLSSFFKADTCFGSCVESNEPIRPFLSFFFNFSSINNSMDKALDW